MIKKARFALTIIFFVIFLIAAPALFFYSQGYRIDFKNKTIVQTGALYFKVLSPKRAEIWINEKLKKRTDWIFDYALIENLVPKEYFVEIKKQGFATWKKKLVVGTSIVTEGKNIVLIPENILFRTFEKDIKKNFPIENSQKLIFQKPILENGAPSWEMLLFDAELAANTLLFSEKDFGTSTEIESLKLSPDSKILILKAKQNSEEKIFFINRDKETIEITAIDFIGNSFENIYFNPQNQKKIFFAKYVSENNGQENKAGLLSIFEADLESRAISGPIVKEVLAWNVAPKEILWISKEGNVMQAGLGGENQRQISAKPFPIKENQKLKIFNATASLLLIEEERLYLFDEKEGLFKEIAYPVKSYAVSFNQEKLALWNNSEIWILFLEKQDDQPKREKGEMAFLLRFSKKIDDVFWLNNHYLVFLSGEEIKISEIDNRDYVNIVDIAKFQNPRLFFAKNILYVFSNSYIFSSESLNF